MNYSLNIVLLFALILCAVQRIESKKSTNIVLQGKGGDNVVLSSDGKKGSNIIVKDSYGSIVLNTGKKKSTNIIIKNDKPHPEVKPMLYHGHSHMEHPPMFHARSATVDESASSEAKATPMASNVEDDSKDYKEIKRQGCDGDDCDTKENKSESNQDESSSKGDNNEKLDLNAYSKRMGDYKEDTFSAYPKNYDSYDGMNSKDLHDFERGFEPGIEAQVEKAVEKHIADGLITYGNEGEGYGSYGPYGRNSFGKDGYYPDPKESYGGFQKMLYGKSGFNNDDQDKANYERKGDLSQGSNSGYPMYEQQINSEFTPQLRPLITEQINGNIQVTPLNYNYAEN